MIKYFRILYYLNKLFKSPYWDIEKLQRYQDKKLQQIVKHAYDSVPYYHDSFKKSGIKPADIKTTKDLKKIPILSKRDIQYNTNKLLSNKYNINNLEVHTTSGSTGKPFKVYLDNSEDDYRKAKHLRANISCGQRPRDKWITLTSPSQFIQISNIQEKLGFFAPKPLSVFIGAPAQLDYLAENKPDILDGFSSSLYLLAKEAEMREEMNVSPKMMFSGAELSSEGMRKYVEKIFQAPFYDQYATIEFERLAWQCPEQIGYHMDVDSTLIQFLDEVGEEVAPGETGDVVCTSLFNYAMPLIRYAVGDSAIPSNEKCSCGRTLPLMNIVSGRKGDFIKLPDGRLLSPTTFIYVILQSTWSIHVDQFRLVQKKIDYFELYIVKRGDSITEAELNSMILSDIHHRMDIRVGDIEVYIKYVEKIPLEKTGKLRSVISEI